MLDFTEKMFELHMQASSTARDERLQYLSVDSFFLALLSSSDVCEVLTSWGVDLDKFRKVLKIKIGTEQKISFIKKTRRPPISPFLEEMLLRAITWKVSSLEGVTLLDGSVIPDARYNITEIDFLRSIWVDVFRMKIQDPSSHQECLPIVHLLLISGARVQKVHQYFSLKNMLEIAECSMD